MMLCFPLRGTAPELGLVTVRRKKSIYGCRQAALNWFLTVDMFFVKEAQRSHSKVEAGIYFGRSVGVDHEEMKIWVGEVKRD